MRFAADLGRVRTREAGGLAPWRNAQAVTVCHASVLKRVKVRKIDAACLAGLGLSR
jgi:hypothetical protein